MMSKTVGSSRYGDQRERVGWAAAAPEKSGIEESPDFTEQGDC